MCEQEKAKRKRRRTRSFFMPDYRIQTLSKSNAEKGRTRQTWMGHLFAPSHLSCWPKPKPQLFSLDMAEYKAV
jgi:hypothetical protein